MTYNDLKQRVEMITFPFNHYPGVIDIVALLRDAENEFIEKTFCTFKTFNDDTSDEDDYTRPITPTDFYRETKVWWNGRELKQLGDINTNPNYLNTSDGTVITGEPYYYFFEGNNIQLFPRPASGGIFRMDYICFNNTVVVATGLIDITTSPILPSSEHKYLVDYAIAKVAEINGQYAISDRYIGQFEANKEMRSGYYAGRRWRQDIVYDDCSQPVNRDFDEFY